MDRSISSNVIKPSILFTFHVVENNGLTVVANNAIWYANMLGNSNSVGLASSVADPLNAIARDHPPVPNFVE